MVIKIIIITIIIIKGLFDYTIGAGVHVISSHVVDDDDHDGQIVTTNALLLHEHHVPDISLSVIVVIAAVINVMPHLLTTFLFIPPPPPPTHLTRPPLTITFVSSLHTNENVFTLELHFISNSQKSDI